MKNINSKLTGGILKDYYKLVHERMIPYQWDALNDLVEGAEKSYCIENIRITAGLSEGKQRGMVFQDSDAAKWLEAVAYCLENGDAKEWEEKADEVISLIAKAQMPDGYFNTYFQLNSPGKRFTNLYEAHELYCLGHFIEAAVAYYDATGKREILDIFCKYADLVGSMYGKGKQKGYPGHQEIELALARLFETTGDMRYLELAEFFLNERGTEPHFFTEEWERRDGYSIWSRRNDPVPKDYSYNQAHLPVREQTAAVGHAVRALYMYAAMAQVGRLSGDKSLLDACRTLLKDVCRQMYVTGGVGSTNHGEAFTFAYDLPNDINYSETCASIALIFFMHAMLKAEPLTLYADIMEQALYNTVLASLGTDGESYFYVNPMEVVPEASEKNPARRHVAARRQKWHGCACCPPNAARLLASLSKYIYNTDMANNIVYVDLYADSALEAKLSGGDLKLSARTRYPLDGNISFSIENAPHSDITLAFRVPGWCEDASFALCGAEVITHSKNGYACLTRRFTSGETVDIRFVMPVRLVRANTAIRSDAGKVCVQRGPLVYCLEECDNGSILSTLIIDTDPVHKIPCRAFAEKASVIGGMPCVMLTAQGYRETDPDDNVYTYAPKKRQICDLTFVPYYLWGNRGPGEMLVWLRES